MTLINYIKKHIAINKLKKYSEDLEKMSILERVWKIHNIKRIVQKEGMEYMNGHFFYGGGFAIPDYRTEEEKQKAWGEKTKDWSEYRKEHGYEEGSYMDIINKKFGGIKDILVSKNHCGPIANIYYFHDYS